VRPTGCYCCGEERAKMIWLEEIVRHCLFKLHQCKRDLLPLCYGEGLPEVYVNKCVQNTKTKNSPQDVLRRLLSPPMLEAQSPSMGAPPLALLLQTSVQQSSFDPAHVKIGCVDPSRRREASGVPQSEKR
jgi:hypothetical protein